MHFEFYSEAFGFHHDTILLQYRYSLDGPLLIHHGLSDRCCFGPHFAGKGMKLWKLPLPFGAVAVGPKDEKRVDYSPAVLPSCWICRVGCKPNNQFFWPRTGRGWLNFWGVAPALSSASTTPWTNLGLNYVKLLWFISSFSLHDKL